MATKKGNGKIATVNVWRSHKLPSLHIRKSKGRGHRAQHQHKKGEHGCGCGCGHFELCEHGHRIQHGQQDGHHHDCGPSKIKHVAIPDCDRRIQLRLAGLTGNLNFQLFRQIGRQVRVELECGEQTSTVTGTVCHVGPDFLDIKQKNGKMITILRNRIIKIEWQKKQHRHN